MPEDVRQRLERFLRKHNPGKLGTIDAILKAYGGREEQMFEALVKKYGPEPPREASPPVASAAAVSPAANAGEPEDVRQRLERFLRKHNPGKLGTIDAILKAYGGREGQMFEALVKKYGPEPPQEESCIAKQQNLGRLGVEEVEVLRCETPPVKQLIENVLHVANASHEDVLLALSREKRGLFAAESGTPPDVITAAIPAGPQTEASSPRLQATEFKARLVRFFTMHAPEKLGGVDALIEAAGPEGADKLIDSLVATYGPEPAGGGEMGDNRGGGDENSPRGFEAGVGAGNESLDERRRLSNWLLASGKNAEQVCYALSSEEQLLCFVRATFGDYENRLRRLFVRYAPPRLREVPRLLADYLGREEEIIEQLARELGPEPARSAPAVLTRLVSRRRLGADRSRIDEETWSDDGENNDGSSEKANVAERFPKSLVDGHALIEAYEANEPGDFSGDEAAAYPRDEEYWYRLFLHPCEAAVHGDNDSDGTSGDGFPRGQRVPASNDELMTASATAQTLEATAAAEKMSIDSPTQPPPAQLRRRSGRTPQVRVTLGNKFGQAIGTLCSACGENVAESFEALWQPVGAQYLQLLSETVVKDGYLEKLSPDSRRMGVKWQKRYFRVNDKGMHYYETDAPSEKPKGYKIFTGNSAVLESIAAAAQPKCTDDRYYYFAVTVNESNDIFYLRTRREEEKRQWVSFLRLALLRMRLTTVGHDQNPSRWRARMAGMKEADIALLELAQASATVLQKLERKHEELQERIRSEWAQRELMETQVREMQKQQELLARRIHEAKKQTRLGEDEADAKCLELAERAASIKQRRLDMKGNLEAAQRSIDGITHSVVRLQREIVDMESECGAREARLRHVYSRWQCCVERRASKKDVPYGSSSS
ncbi:uncharacterized protein Tco025E_04311 [Trypanosoma conorhini]|uniref:PH domain-containing protein n=1 Tax=Trypanosoma conorhini TaxID=83891 RepID=A0A422PMD4_9TRYP|nr:uncharacterized protein Tco025E_04311 [Trypanosoma conorhini]RNF18875.1 hypothetical protein Tco025E_04311 [Trypanosoma conorhini]